MQNNILYKFFLILICLNPLLTEAQLSAPGSSASEVTNYPTFRETDMIYIFCTENENEQNGILQVQTDLEGTKSILWEKYNNETASFEYYAQENTDSQQSTISQLESGGYRVTVTGGGTNEIARAWVFNNFISASAGITDIDCSSFRLEGSFISSPLIYYDLADNTELQIDKEINAEWKDGQVIIAKVLSAQIFDPPYIDTDYTLHVYDRFGCEDNEPVTYHSVVTKAEFTVDPQQGEAPLTVNFNNQSKNGDEFQWFFFRDLDEIKNESENSEEPVDSIMIVAYDQNPVYTYENSGTYMVKLISVNISDSVTCADTVYLEDYIVVDTSFVAVPNVFTPNGDGTNDLFVVKFWSMKSLKIQIFNRWGKRIHFWQSNDIRGFEETYTATVWDGRIGGRWASPGVYYYVIEGSGRDDKKRRAHGFFHLFRDKQQNR